MPFQFACQTITWGEKQRENFPAVFAEIAAAGYAGAEIGFRHIQPIPPTRLREMLEKSNLTLFGSHIGGNLENPGQADKERSVLDEVLDYLHQMECGVLMYSGLRYETDEQFARDLAALGRAAEKCRDSGVRLLYHNHDWEFADSARVMNVLVRDSDPALGFCPDVGWAHRGGADLPALLDSIRDRIGAVHFKDFAAEGAANPFITLGDGVVPFPLVAEWLERNLPNAWVVAEQDRADCAPGDAAKANALYLRQVFSGDHR